MMKATGRSSIVLALTSLLALGTRCEYLSQPYFKNLNLRIERGEAPHVGYIEALRTPEYIARGRLKALDGVVGGEIFDRFYPELLGFFQRSGQTYALPADFQTLALLLNEELFRRAGLTSDSGEILVPQSWSDVREFSVTLKERTGVFGVGLTSEMWNFLPFLYQAGGSLLDESRRRVTLDSAEAEEAMTFYTSLALDGLALVPAASAEAPDEQPFYEAPIQLLEAFGRGEVGMIIVPNNSYEAVTRRAPDLQLRAVELPAGPAGRATIPYVTGLAIFRERALQNEAAIELLLFGTGEQRMEMWAESVIYMPADRELQDLWRGRHPEAAAFMDGAEYMRNYQPASATFERIQAFDLQSKPILAEALAGKISAGAALSELQALGDELLSS